jgi:heptosyltransferase-2
LLAAHPYIRKVLIWDKKTSKYAHLWQLSRQIRHTKYDWVINCQRFAASGWLTAFSGASQRIGFDKNPFARFFTQRIPHTFGTSAHSLHEVDRNLRLIESLTDTSFQRPVLHPRAQDRDRAAALRPSGAYICIAPTSVWFTKQLPAHKWLELIRRLPSDVSVVLLGAAEDHAACDYILQKSERKDVYNLAGQLNLLASAALMESAVMNYVNDSAPMHLASAVNAPVTAVFCSTIPAFGFTPLSDISRIIEVQTPLSCRPCGLHGFKKCPQGHFRCAEDIQFNGSV